MFHRAKFFPSSKLNSAQTMERNANRAAYAKETMAAKMAAGVVHPRNANSTIPSYKKGGTVKKTGPALLHKGEKVLTTGQKKAYSAFTKMKNRK